MNRKKMKKSRQKKVAAAFFLVLVLSLSPCSVFLGGNVSAKAATFTITKLKKESIIQDGYFYFYGSLMLPEVFYWIKNDGSPLFCIQKKANIVTDLYGNEVVEEYDSSRYLNEEKYELISLVLQCCGMIQGEEPVLEPGTYLAGQAAVWGITSPNWRDSQYFRKEMEIVHEHVNDWYDTPAEEILAQSQEAVDRICEAIDAYYGDESPYIPAFASKYEKKAPVWTVTKKQDGSCEAEFSLEDKSEAIKEFEFQMPEGWSCEWQDDKITFRCEQAEEGLLSFQGRAKEGSVLDEAMPIGLIHIVGPANFPHFQRLASEVECKTNWSCYFKLLVSEPEDRGSWYLPEVQHYRHQETFTALYGAGIEKLDGESMEAIAGVEFQPLEYFDDSQLENTRLDTKQIDCWNGWKAVCSPEITDQNGHLEHWDKRKYFYEKTYCSGHPDPVISYEGNDEDRKEQLEKEAEEAWENEVEECSQVCDFHCIDGSGERQLEEDRDLTYQQFIHLVYGYSFKETKAAPGYLPFGKHEGDEEIGQVFLVSVQAGGEPQEYRYERGQEDRFEKRQEEKQKTELKQEAEVSMHAVDKVKASQGEYASDSNAEHSGLENKKIEDAAKAEKEKEDGAEKEKDIAEKEKEDAAEKEKGTAEKEKEDGAEKEKDIAEKEKDAVEENTAEEEKETKKEPEQKNEQGKMKKAGRQKRESYVWVNSLIAPLAQVMPDSVLSYSFIVKNYREKTPPEESKPEESQPEETPPESTPEIPPEETPPEPTPDIPPEESSAENPPEESPPEKTPPVVSYTPGGSDGRRKVEVLPPETLPPETSESFFVEEEAVPQAVSRMGWIEANYATPSVARKGKQDGGNPSGSLPKTGDRGISTVILLMLSAGSGGALLLCLKKRRRAAVFFLSLVACIPWLNGVQAKAEEVQVQTLEMQVQAEEKERKNPPPLQEAEIEENQKVIYFSKKAVSGEDEDASVEWSGEWTGEWAEGRRSKGAIKETITDESGQKYWLESCRLVTRILPEKEEWVSEKVAYSAVEVDGQIPESLWFQAEEEDTGRLGEGELRRTSVSASIPYWNNQFEVALRFCDYDAETYRLREMEVPKEQALEYLTEHQQGLLEAVGCSANAYQIDRIVWNGEPYLTSGVMYRDALAYGRKLVSDYSAEYAGNVIYPEQEQEQWEAVYALQVPDAPQQDLIETEVVEIVQEEVKTAASEPDVFPEKNTFSWIKLRTIAAYTVSFAVFLPVCGYFILLISRKKKPSAE